MKKTQSPDTKRVGTYKKDSACEDLFEIMNKALIPRERELLKGFGTPNLPVIFIVGAQRSGTTLLMQLMIQSFKLSYPNNFIARYWDVPYFGAMLYKGFAKDIESQQTSLSSDLGYTKGMTGPHEFGYFWKKWFPWESWESVDIKLNDYDILKRQLAAWESISENPLLFKNIVQMDFKISAIKKILPTAFFIFLKRDLIYNVQSTYQSRIKLFGDEREWFGAKPPGFHKYLKLPVLEQVAMQIIGTNSAIQDQLNAIPACDQETVQYENLVENPEAELRKLRKRLALKIRRQNVFSKSELVSGNSVKVSRMVFSNIEKICESLSV